MLQKMFHIRRYPCQAGLNRIEQGSIRPRN
jgi:hypothetical protein